MSTEKSTCPHRADFPADDTPDPQIDPCTRDAFRSLRLDAEELALGLAVRLRVLGKSLVAGCRGAAPPTDRKAHAYKALRLQLDEFMRFFVERGFAQHPGFPTLRRYLKDLPSEMVPCSGKICWLEMIDDAIAMLSESGWEKDGLGESASSVSL